MGWKATLGKKKTEPSQQEIAALLQKLGRNVNRKGKELGEYGFKKTIFGHASYNKTKSKPNKEKDEVKEEVQVDTNTLGTLVAIIQETMHEQHEPAGLRWSKRLQWPSQKYLRTSWVQVYEQLQPDYVHYKAGQAKIFSANAGDIACLGPCLLQAAEPIQTVIVHGELEYCTLLGHVLHIDLAVYFAALRTLARFLKGNTHVRELVFAFTSCPKVVTDKSQEPVFEGFASQVLPAFESLLEEHKSLRYVSFRMTHTATQHVNIGRMCSTFYESNCAQRTAMLCASHPKVKDPSPLACKLPTDVSRKIMDLAFPLPGPPRVDFEFSHISSAENRSTFCFFRFGKRTVQLQKWEAEGQAVLPYNQGNPIS